MKFVGICVLAILSLAACRTAVYPPPIYATSPTISGYQRPQRTVSAVGENEIHSAAGLVAVFQNQAVGLFSILGPMAELLEALLRSAPSLARALAAVMKAGPAIAPILPAFASHLPALGREISRAFPSLTEALPALTTDAPTQVMQIKVIPALMKDVSSLVLALPALTKAKFGLHGVFPKATNFPILDGILGAMLSPRFLRKLTSMATTTLPVVADALPAMADAANEALTHMTVATLEVLPALAKTLPALAKFTSDNLPEFSHILPVLTNIATNVLPVFAANLPTLTRAVQTAIPAMSNIGAEILRALARANPTLFKTLNAGLPDPEIYKSS